MNCSENRKKHFLDVYDIMERYQCGKTIAYRVMQRIRCANGGKTAIGKGKLLWRELEKWEGSKNEN